MFRLDGQVRLEEQYEPAADGWQMKESGLSRSAGLAYRGNADPFIAKLVAAAAHKPLGALIRDLAQELGREEAEVKAPLIGIVRRLVEQGFLVPMADGSN